MCSSGKTVETIEKPSRIQAITSGVRPDEAGRGSESGRAATVLVQFDAATTVTRDISHSGTSHNAHRNAQLPPP